MDHPQGPMTFEEQLVQQRALAVQHFVRLRQVDVAYARYALSALENMKDCPFPEIRADVQAAWAEHLRNNPEGGRDGSAAQ